MIVYIDNGYLIGLYYQKEGFYYGDGTKHGAYIAKNNLND